jgi:hypothetical protein
MKRIYHILRRSKFFYACIIHISHLKNILPACLSGYKYAKIFVLDLHPLMQMQNTDVLDLHPLMQVQNTNVLDLHPPISPKKRFKFFKNNFSWI